MAKKLKRITSMKRPHIRVVSGEPESHKDAVQETMARVKTAREDGTMSGLDAAAKVLTDAGTPLNAKEILERIQKAGLWKTNGKTPQATLYASILRDIAAKKKDSRFRKTERGHFATA